MTTSTIKRRKIDVQIRWMIRRDMPEVIDIEQGAFQFPWTEEDFLNSLKQRNCIGMVAEVRDRIVGFMVYEPSEESIARFELRRRWVVSASMCWNADGAKADL